MMISTILYVSLCAVAMASEPQAAPELGVDRISEIANQRMLRRTYFATPLEGRESTIPPCLPVAGEVSKKKAKLRYARNWTLTTVATEVVEASPAYGKLEDCVRDVYAGRFTDEQLSLLLEDEVRAGMPFEFALISLGPPQGRPTFISELNPVSGEPETRLSYVWNLSKPSDDPGLGLQILATVALGAAASASDLDAAIDAFRVAAIADLGAEIVRAASSVNDAQLVTVEVYEDGTIFRVTIT